MKDAERLEIRGRTRPTRCFKMVVASEGTAIAENMKKARSARRTRRARFFREAGAKLTRARIKPTMAIGTIQTHPSPRMVTSWKKRVTVPGKCRMAAAIGLSSANATTSMRSIAAVTEPAPGKRSSGAALAVRIRRARRCAKPRAKPRAKPSETALAAVCALPSDDIRGFDGNSPVSPQPPLA